MAGSASKPKPFRVVETQPPGADEWPPHLLVVTGSR
jgi:hypothetical protein